MTHTLRCNNPDCTLLQGGRCARASELPGPPLEHCPDLQREASSAAASPPGAEPAPAPPPPSPAPAPPPRSTAPTPASDPAPWKGRHLHPDEVQELLWRSPARVVGVLGPYNAGKTCLLTSFFLQVANGQREGLPYRFASSRSLSALLDLSRRAQEWRGDTDGEIVAHTPRGEEVSWLHLGLRPSRDGDERHIDLLLSDLPGEWAAEWTRQQDDVTLGRMRFLERCDAWIVVADAAELMRSARADSDASRLIRRLSQLRSEGARARALAVTLTKWDSTAELGLPPEHGQRRDREAWGPIGRRFPRLWAAVDQAQQGGLEAQIFPVSAFPHPIAEGGPVGVIAPFTWLLDLVDPTTRWSPREVGVPPGARAFDAMRRWRHSP